MSVILPRSSFLLPWLGAVLLAAGLVRSDLLAQLPANRASELLVLALLAWALAWVLRRVLHGRTARPAWASALALAWCPALLLFCGVLPVLATLLLALAACALGTRLAPRQPMTLQLVLGLALLAGGLGWMLLLPVHYRWSYLLLCAGLLFWQRNALLPSLHAARARWQISVQQAPRSAALAVMITGLASTACWLPTLQYDDLTYHLRLPWQLMLSGVYTPAPEQQIWALAPWASDVIHAFAQVLAGAEARGPVNALWLLVLGAGAWQFARHLSAGPVLRWFAVALVASLPLTPGLATSMQTELSSAAVLVWMCALTAAAPKGGLRFWLQLAVLAGLLAASKTMAAATAIPVLLWALLRHPWPSVSRIVLVIATGLVVGGASYAQSAWLTGNPVLPLFNGVFQSPYYAPVNFADARYQLGFNAALPWSLTFDSARYFESRNGAAGVVLVALAGCWLLALLRPATRAAALVTAAVLVVPLLPVQYLRYAYPGLVLLCVVAAAAVNDLPLRAAVGLLAAVCVLNVGLHANGNWMLRGGAVKQLVLAGGDVQPLQEHYAPERALASALRDGGRTDGTILLLDAGEPFAAEFGQRGRSVSWYAPRNQQAAAAAEQDPLGSRWSMLLHTLQVSEVILRTETLTAPQQRALQLRGAVLREERGGRQWWSLPAAGPSPGKEAQ